MGVKEEVLNTQRQGKVKIPVSNWKAPGPDQVQGYWLKNFTSLHNGIEDQLQECVASGIVPSWMTWRVELYSL